MAHGLALAKVMQHLLTDDTQVYMQRAALRAAADAERWAYGI
jgi:hypothetical protein